MGSSDGIMHKAHRNRPLFYWQKLHNLLIGKRRYVVKQSFGTLKRRFQFVGARYMGREKVQAQMIMKTLCLNLLKGGRKIQIAPPDYRISASKIGKINQFSRNNTNHRHQIGQKTDPLAKITQIIQS